MTPKEAINYANGMLKNGGNKQKQDFVKVVTEALEKADKYAWHDLRKDPLDVPQHTDLVLVLFEDNRCDLTWATSPHWLKYEDKIIAWKEIELEPFEELEE